KRKQF
ncbi:DNA gyrase/topoisomerase IV, subunit A family protein, partial [Vibrio parahaemolyticus VPTS-2010]